jgi:hypothetical protein
MFIENSRLEKNVSAGFILFLTRAPRSCAQGGVSAISIIITYNTYTLFSNIEITPILPRKSPLFFNRLGRHLLGV